MNDYVFGTSQGVKDAVVDQCKKLVNSRMRKMPVQITKSDIMYHAFERATGILASVVIARVDDREIVIERVYTVPQHRRKGLSGILFKRLFRDFPDHTFFLTVANNNIVARGFYQKLGFAIYIECGIKRKWCQMIRYPDHTKHIVPA